MTVAAQNIQNEIGAANEQLGSTNLIVRHTNKKMEVEEDPETEPPPPPPPPPVQFAWEWFGPGELLALQEQMELMPLLVLRMTNKAVRADLDAVMPPAVRLVHWILDKKLVDNGIHPWEASNPLCCMFYGNPLCPHAHENMQHEPCMRRAPTRLLFDAFVLLLGGMRSTITYTDCVVAPKALGHRYGRTCAFSARSHKGLALALKKRISDVIHGDGGRGTLTPYEGTTAAEHAAIYGPPQPLSEDESIALLADIFDRAGEATGPICTHDMTHGVVWTPFIMAALEAKVGVLRFLAARTGVDPHEASDEGNNAYAYVLHSIQEDIERYEKDEGDFPDPEIFNEVRPGETYALYVARRRDELQTKYALVLAYLRDELGLDTQSWNNEYDSMSEPSDEEPSESEEEEEGEEEEPSDDEEEGDSGDGE